MGVCIFCGENKPITKEHIPPKNLFGKPRPDLITVPSCFDCNNKSSDDDEYFRLVHISHWGVKIGKVGSMKDVHEAAFRGIQNPSKYKFKESFLNSLYPVELRTPSGLYAGKEWAIDVNFGRLEKSINKIVQGLFYHHYSKIIQHPYGINSFYIDTKIEPPKEFVPILSSLISSKPNIIGEGHFTYWHRFIDNQNIMSAWLLRFYGEVYWFGLIGDFSKLDRFPNK